MELIVGGTGQNPRRKKVELRGWAGQGLVWASNEAAGSPLISWVSLQVAEMGGSLPTLFPKLKGGIVEFVRWIAAPETRPGASPLPSGVSKQWRSAPSRPIGDELADGPVQAMA